MWKDFFYFNKSQRIGTIVLILLITTTTLFILIMPCFFKEKDVDDEDNEVFWKQVEAFKAGLREKDKNKPQRTYQPFERYNYKAKTRYAEQYRLFPFDPNEADSVTLVSLGIKPYIARNIIRYRQKGGRFDSADSFGKIYGIDEEKLTELKPYIQIALRDTINRSAETDGNDQKDEVEKKFTPKAALDYLVDLNTADTTELMKIRGIGKYYAQGIISYRNRLGGYHSIEQIREVRGMNDESFERIRNALTVDELLIRKININRAGVDLLKRHPYIESFTKAKAIYDYRRKIGKIEGMEELNRLEELSDKDRERLSPYLEFK